MPNKDSEERIGGNQSASASIRYELLPCFKCAAVHCHINGVCEWCQMLAGEPFQRYIKDMQDIADDLDRMNP